MCPVVHGFRFAGWAFVRHIVMKRRECDPYGRHDPAGTTGLYGRRVAAALHLPMYALGKFGSGIHAGSLEMDANASGVTGRSQA